MRRQFPNFTESSCLVAISRYTAFSLMARTFPAIFGVTSKTFGSSRSTCSPSGSGLEDTFDGRPRCFCSGLLVVSFTGGNGLVIFLPFLGEKPQATLRCQWRRSSEEVRRSGELIDFGEVSLQHLPDAAIVIGDRLQQIEVLGQQISHVVDRLVTKCQHPMRSEDPQQHLDQMPHLVR